MEELLKSIRDRADDEHLHEILARVYRGRRSLRLIGLRPDDPDMGVVIVVSPQMWTALMTISRRRIREGSIEMTPTGPRILGLAVDRDASLGPTEIRLRSEVIL